MRLLNQTKCPVNILSPIFQQAADAIGVDSTNLTVKITARRTGIGIAGIAYHETWRGVDIKITLPARVIHHSWHGKIISQTYDALMKAEYFWIIAAHEFSHVLDYQANRQGACREFNHFTEDHRSIKHDSRPQEIRAEQYAHAAKQSVEDNVEYQENLLALAVWLDNLD